MAGACSRDRSELSWLSDRRLQKLPLGMRSFSHMALTSRSVTSAAKRRAQRAFKKVLAAESKLVAANSSLRDASTRGRSDLGEAANQTLAAEHDLREAAKELEVVTELLAEPAAGTPSDDGRSGEGLDSLLPHLIDDRKQKPGGGETG
jgi:hypothetical protein